MMYLSCMLSTDAAKGLLCSWFYLHLSIPSQCQRKAVFSPLTRLKFPVSTLVIVRAERRLYQTSLLFFPARPGYYQNHHVKCLFFPVSCGRLHGLFPSRVRLWHTHAPLFSIPKFSSLAVIALSSNVITSARSWTLHNPAAFLIEYFVRTLIIEHHNLK